MKCVKCGADKAGVAICEPCSARTSSIAPGSRLYNGRFQIEALEYADTSALAWAATDTTTQQPYVLREYSGGGQAAKRRFAELTGKLRHLPDVVIPPHFVFTHIDECWLAEGRQSRTTLADVAAQKPSPSERRCREVFTQLLRALEALHAQAPFFHGNLRPETVACEDGRVRLLHLGCLDAGAPPVETGISRDIQAAAATIAKLLCANMEEARTKWEKRIGEVEDLPLAAALQWMLADSAKRPPSIAAVGAFLENVEKAQASRSASRFEEARVLFDEAYSLSGAAKIGAVLGELKEKAAPASAKVEPRVPDPAKPTPTPLPPPPVQSQEPSPARLCWQCGHAVDPESAFCESCGAPKDRIAPPPVPVRTDRSRILLLAAAVVALLVWLYVQFGPNSLQREFDAQMAAGNLATANSRSAYGIYLEAVQRKGAGSDMVQQMSRNALPVLEQRSRDALQAWYTRGEIGNITWDELQRVEDWRNRITNSDASRAAREYAAGMVAFTQRRFSEARQLFESALSASPNWTLALNAVGRACYNLRDFGCAERFYRSAAAADPRWYYPRFNLANLYAHNFHNYPAAEALYQEAIGLDSTRASFHFEYANLLYALGRPRWRQACTEYRSALNGQNSPLQPGQINLVRQRVQKACQ